MDIDDMCESPALDIIELLRQKGADVRYHDPYVAEFAHKGHGLRSEANLADLAGAGFCNVDLVSLDTDDIVLKYEAVRQNALIYQADDFDRGAYYSRSVRRFLDFRPYLRVQREAYKMRVVHDQA